MNKTELSNAIIELDNSQELETLMKLTKAQLESALDALELEAAEDGDEEEEELTAGQKMARTLAKARVRYVKSKTASGKATMNNGDQIALALQPFDHVQVAMTADLILGEEIGHHMNRYGHLNNGQIRMNSGNRIRGAVKRGDIEIEGAMELILEQAKTYGLMA